MYWEHFAQHNADLAVVVCGGIYLIIITFQSPITNHAIKVECYIISQGTPQATMFPTQDRECWRVAMPATMAHPFTGAQPLFLEGLFPPHHSLGDLDKQNSAKAV